jgi:hypothetical protein
MVPEGWVGQMCIKRVFNIGKIFLYGPKLLRWAMWPMGLLFHWYRDVYFAGERLQNLGLCSALRAFERGGIFIVPHLLYVTWDFGFSGLIRRTAPFRHLLRHTWGCGGSILTRILTGLFKQKKIIYKSEILLRLPRNGAKIRRRIELYMREILLRFEINL